MFGEFLDFEIMKLVTKYCVKFLTVNGTFCVAKYDVHDRVQK